MLVHTHHWQCGDTQPVSVTGRAVSSASSVDTRQRARVRMSDRSVAMVVLDTATERVTTCVTPLYIVSAGLFAVTRILILSTETFYSLFKTVFFQNWCKSYCVCVVDAVFCYCGCSILCSLLSHRNLCALLLPENKRD